METELTFDPIRLPPECAALRNEAREFLAKEIEAGTFNPHEAGNDQSYSEEFSRKVGARGWLPRALCRHRGVPRRQRAGAPALRR
jgi:hypothetical protein